MADDSLPDSASEAGDADDSGETDSFFGFVAGFYTAALTAPVVAIAVALRLTTDPGALFFVLLGAAVAVMSGVGWVARRESLAVRLGSSRWVWTAMALPFGYFGVLFAVEARGGTPPSAVAGLAVLGALAGLLAGVGLVTASHNRHAKAVLADAETLAEFTAPAPDRDRRIVERAVVGLFAASLLGFVASAVTDFAPLRWLFQILVPTAAGLWGSTTDRTVVVSDAGLVAGNPVHKRFRPWSAFESYDVTDEAIVVRRSGWSAWGLLDVRRNPAEVEDPEAIAAALGSHLPRER